MNIEELMIGNIIQDLEDEGIAYEVARLDTEEYNQWNHDDNTQLIICKAIIESEYHTYFELEKPAPIKITRQWLLNFGFKVTGENNEWLELNYQGFNFNTDSSVNYERVFLPTRKGKIEINFIHELQNTYFWNTKQKLKLKSLSIES